jgi:hypothetical protein
MDVIPASNQCQELPALLSRHQDGLAANTIRRRLLGGERQLQEVKMRVEADPSAESRL